jgi:hypothetical protein
MKRIIMALILLFTLAACGFRHFEFLTMPSGDKVRVQLAATDEERARGLGGIKKMDGFAGMLFVEKEPSQADFWMASMQFPIDIIFLDVDKKVLEIYENEQPCVSVNNCPSILSGSTDVKYELELPAGLAERYKVTINSTINW